MLVDISSKSVSIHNCFHPELVDWMVNRLTVVTELQKSYFERVLEFDGAVQESP